ncbi:hypothetical protein SOCE26_052060 [Sorangium cellulosum]|uniref:Uncharacterized protein n=1 Tax=Sorangium cellulosum TaxID=56 RepID=A0A2L0EWS0_SORCE|nr:hypothetical protein [Sorangium cellulosum]AUX43751.1 hypothetical protein SOCE26_052060 [Sorangium cellulosum]
MSPGDSRVSIVILTEDSGADGRATVEALVGRMLELVAPGYGRHRVDFLPSEPREEEAMRGNVWKTDGRNPVDHERRVRLLRYIARKLLLPDTFVVFHIDGDRPWSERSTSENLAKFDRRVLTVLPQVVERGHANAPRTRRKGKGGDEPPAPVLQLGHLLLVCPFRSIEAWLYQNVRRASEICRREHAGRHVGDIEAWEGKREELDELPAPDDVLCLKKAYNLELASHGFPTQLAYDARKSFAESVDRLSQCGALRAALERTRGWG